MGSTERILIYSHDTYGLGHLRRCLRIAEGLSRLSPRPSVLIATGSPRAQSFSLPHGCDTVKLPAATKGPDGRYRARSLAIPLDELVGIRSDLLRTAASSFQPDLILVDHAPVGMAGELLPLLKELHHRARPRLVLGLRDVVDEARRVRAEWEQAGAWHLLETMYDAVLVYGDQRVLTTAEELGLADRLGGKVQFVGYLGGRAAVTDPPLGNEPPSIVVTAGGGGDGQRLLRSYAAFLEQFPAPAPFRSVIVTGPLLSEHRQAELRRRFSALGHPLELLTFTERLEELLSRAAGVVAMAGYNTVTEILSARVPALLMPRGEPRREQLLRAERLVGLTGLEMCPPGGDQVAAIAEFVPRALHRGRLPVPALRLAGVETVAAEMARLVQTGAGASALVERGDRVARVV
ncbi:MAG: hypothetical protein KY454_03705 [Actinobacteria bacterium]|nr:hypothetical protein [Actinomycetota bacterium]MBW3649600.1 hypothetical protein [Actinomycetota bacterium]